MESFSSLLFRLTLSALVVPSSAAAVKNNCANQPTDTVRDRLTIMVEPLAAKTSGISLRKRHFLLTDTWKAKVTVTMAAFHLVEPCLDTWCCEYLTDIQGHKYTSK